MPKIYIFPHKKVLIWFLVLVIILLGGIGYGLVNLSYGARLIIKPALEEIDIDFLAKIGPSDDLLGKIFESVQEEERAFTPKATVSMEDYAEGEILLTNNTWSPRTLVAATRFVSAEGLLFRSIDQVRVPAQGETKVKVRADEKGPKFEVEPSKFSIPGLTSSFLKENILAESKEKMTGGTREAGVVTQADIDEAKDTLRKELSEKATQEIKKELSEENLKLVTKSGFEAEACDAKDGDEKAKFSVSTKLKIGAVAFKENDLRISALEKLKEKIPADKEFASCEEDSLTYRLKEYDTGAQTAQLEVQLRGYMIINRENSILEKNKFKGLTRAEIENYFKEFSAEGGSQPKADQPLAGAPGGKVLIRNVRIKFWPPFLKKAPDDAARIEIEIVK